MNIEAKVILVLGITITFPTTFESLNTHIRRPPGTAPQRDHTPFYNGTDLRESGGGPSVFKKEDDAGNSANPVASDTTSLAPESGPKDCDCFPGIEFTLDCLCSAALGYIKSQNITGSDTTYIYTFDPLLEGLLYVVVEPDDLGDLSNSYCSITIGDLVLSSSITENEVYFGDTSLNITAHSKGAPTCYWTITYAVYDFQNVTETTSEYEGNFSSPVDTTGLLQYRPYFLGYYIISIPDPDFFIEMKVTLMDLGYPLPIIHDEARKVNKSNGDFLLIGSGEIPFLGKDDMFFGSVDFNVTLRIPSNVAHLMFFSGFHYQNDRKGYHIDYVAFMRGKTTTPVPTTPPSTLPTPPPDTDVASWISLNGISPDQDVETLISLFQETVAEMVSIYAKDANITFQEDVSSKYIEVLEVALCDPVYCEKDCVAFYFQANLHLPDGSWALTADDLDAIVRDSDSLNLWQNLAQDCYICDEDPETKWGILVAVAIVVIAFTVFAIMLFRKIHHQSDVDEKKLQYEAHIRELVQDIKRKGSDKASILGENIDSRHASLASRRFSMPVPNLRNSEAMNASFSYSFDGMEDFSTYDPEKGEQDNRNPAQFALEKELLPKKGVLNHGFVKDEKAVNFTNQPNKSITKFVTTAVIENDQLSQSTLQNLDVSSLHDQNTTTNPLTFGWNFNTDSAIQPSYEAKTSNQKKNPFVYGWNIAEPESSEKAKRGAVHFASAQLSSDDDNISRRSEDVGETSSRLHQRRGTQFVSPKKLRELLGEDADEETDSEESVISVVEKRTTNAREENQLETSPQQDVDGASDGDARSHRGPKRSAFFQEDLQKKKGEELSEGLEEEGQRGVHFHPSENEEETDEEELARARKAKLQQRRGTQFVSPAKIADLLDESDSEDSTDEGKESALFQNNDFLYIDESDDDDPTDGGKVTTGLRNHELIKEGADHNLTDDQSGEESIRDYLESREESDSNKVQFLPGTKVIDGDDASSSEDESEEKRAKLKQRRGTKFISLAEIRKLNELDEDETSDANESNDVELEAFSKSGEREKKQGQDQTRDNKDNFQKKQVTVSDASDAATPSTSGANTKNKTGTTASGVNVLKGQASTHKSTDFGSDTKMTIGEYLDKRQEGSDIDEDTWSRGYCSIEDDNMSERSLVSTTDGNFL